MLLVKGRDRWLKASLVIFPVKSYHQCEYLLREVKSRLWGWLWDSHFCSSCGGSVGRVSMGKVKYVHGRWWQLGFYVMNCIPQCKSIEKNGSVLHIYLCSYYLNKIIEKNWIISISAKICYTPLHLLFFKYLDIRAKAELTSWLTVNWSAGIFIVY